MKLIRFAMLIFLSSFLFACSTGNQEGDQDGENVKRNELAISADHTESTAPEDVGTKGENLEGDMVENSGGDTLIGSDREKESNESGELEELIEEESEGMDEYGNKIDPDKVDHNKNKTTKSLKNITKIIYRFRDASVPPPYHRSFRVIVTPEESNEIVTDYSDELSNTTTKLEDGAWDELVKLAQKIQKPGEYEARGATGTTGNTIQIFNGDEQIYSLYWDSLSKDKIKASTLAFKDAINATVGDSEPFLKKED